MIRRAEPKDLEGINSLLSQVLEVHAAGRPDIFISGKRKYRDDQILEIIKDDTHPVFVYEKEDGFIAGHAFCQFEETKNRNSLHDMLTLY
ncbi:MAG: GNAT family N-acetyltransferase, partial [Clostridia bacterium]|nr:GNAT family N-acetyltransferase [Clostridia bacterium]